MINEMRSAELVIINSNPTSVSGIVVFIKLSTSAIVAFFCHHYGRTFASQQKLFNAMALSMTFNFLTSKKVGFFVDNLCTVNQSER